MGAPPEPVSQLVRPPPQREGGDVRPAGPARRVQLRRLVHPALGGAGCLVGRGFARIQSQLAGHRHPLPAAVGGQRLAVPYSPLWDRLVPFGARPPPGPAWPDVLGEPSQGGHDCHLRRRGWHHVRARPRPLRRRRHVRLLSPHTGEAAHQGGGRLPRRPGPAHRLAEPKVGLGPRQLRAPGPPALRAGGWRRRPRVSGPERRGGGGRREQLHLAGEGRDPGLVHAPLPPHARVHGR
mmetsp:Transcript_89146/g.273005  ORF Transcript_89146/g.273005 Transcript_89146/m.273005 type:complete len:237 (-) Transcript_89146:237-947(-)